MLSIPATAFLEPKTAVVKSLNSMLKACGLVTAPKAVPTKVAEILVVVFLVSAVVVAETVVVAAVIAVALATRRAAAVVAANLVRSMAADAVANLAAVAVVS